MRIWIYAFAAWWGRCLVTFIWSGIFIFSLFSWKIYGEWFESSLVIDVSGVFGIERNLGYWGLEMGRQWGFGIMLVERRKGRAR